MHIAATMFLWVIKILLVLFVLLGVAFAFLVIGAYTER